MSDGPSVDVCLVGPSLDILGGQAIQADRLLKRLSQLPSIDVSFLPVNPRLWGPLRLLQRIKYVRTVVTEAAYAGLLLLRTHRHDVIHAFSASYTSYLLAPLPALLAGRLFGKAVVLNYRSGEASDHLARSAFAIRTMRLAHTIVVPSGYLVEVFAEFGLRAVAIPNFVDLEEISYRERTHFRPRFLSNRNFEPLYNIGCTLRAFAIIQQRIPDASLTLVGDGSQRAALEVLANELGLRNVSFAGKIAPSRMREFYDAADVYLNSPNIDNMPTSIIEAFASGVPVVTTNAGGIPFVVTHGETGLMVERDDHEGMARFALQLLDDQTMARALAMRAREECLARYLWERVALQWEALYRGLFSSRAVRR